MSVDNRKKGNLTRRGFFRKAAAAGAGVAATAAIASYSPAASAASSLAASTASTEATGTATPAAQRSPTATPTLPAGLPKKWDMEAEVVVVGYGGAGACAAIAAADEGASVLILEKQAEDAHTANTRMCAGVFVSPTNVEDAIAFMKVASRVNVDFPESQALENEIIEVWAEYMVENREWLQGLGAKDFNVYAESGRDASIEGNEAIKAYQLQMEDGTSGVGVQFFDLLDSAVKEREIPVLWETPGMRLITNEAGEVVGVWAKSSDGDVAIKASRAVILTTGGFEFDEEAVKQYLPVWPMVFYGNPANTGDGIRMAQEVGADLWHMTVLGGGLKAKFDDFPTAFVVGFGQNGYIIVNKFGERFADETILGGYSGYWHTFEARTAGLPVFPRIPVYWIFDEKRRQAGPLTYTFFGAAGPIGMYEWSQDNSVEIEKGWIIKGETIEELAEKLELDPDTLQEQVDRYNEAAESGEDADFGRPAGTLVALDEPPYYAVPLWPGMNNTFGGPRRNAKAQIVDVYGNPIPRLYSAGELGSIYVQYPQGGANVGECIAFGRIAGEQAATLEPWEDD